MKTPKQSLKKNYTPLIWTLALSINLLIAASFFLPGIESLQQYDFTFLPLLNAILNSLTFLSLLIAMAAVKKKNIARHKTFVLLAFFWTSLFLVSYLLYHFFTPSTKFGAEAFIRYVYFFILLTHIFLAVIIVPLALISIGYGLNMDIARHRRIAR